MGGTGFVTQLAAAVCNAGGLGVLHLWRADVPTLRSQIRELRTLTDKPFAVNLNLEFPQHERLDACLDEGVPVISLFWGDPGATRISRQGRRRDRHALGRVGEGS